MAASSGQHLAATAVSAVLECAKQQANAPPPAHSTVTDSLGGGRPQHVFTV